VKKYGLSRRQRICSGADFERVYAAKQRAGDKLLLIFGTRNELGYTRLGVSVSRRHGNAVVRSRLKRMLREAFRLSQHELPVGLDLILIPREGSSAELGDLLRSLVSAAKKLSESLPATMKQQP
jgi:ribonuclease P protein component